MLHPTTCVLTKNSVTDDMEPTCKKVGDKVLDIHTHMRALNTKNTLGACTALFLLDESSNTKSALHVFEHHICLGCFSVDSQKFF